VHDLTNVSRFKCYDLISLSYDVNSDILSVSGDVVFTTRNIAESLDDAYLLKAATLNEAMAGGIYYDIEANEMVEVCLVELNYNDFRTARGLVDSRKKRKGDFSNIYIRLCRLMFLLLGRGKISTQRRMSTLVVWALVQGTVNHAGDTITVQECQDDATTRLTYCDCYRCVIKQCNKYPIAY
jgi:hypothetical protein